MRTLRIIGVLFHSFPTGFPKPCAGARARTRARAHARARVRARARGLAGRRTCYEKAKKTPKFFFAPRKSKKGTKKKKPPKKKKKKKKKKNRTTNKQNRSKKIYRNAKIQKRVFFFFLSRDQNFNLWSRKFFRVVICAAPQRSL